MRRFPVKPFQMLAAANALVASLALAWMIWTLWSEQQSFTEPPNDPLDNVGLPAVSIETSAVKAHPLFAQNRLPVPEQPRSDDQDALKIQPPPLVVGIFKGSQGELGAIMEDAQTGARKFVRDGGEFMGWKLTAIRPKVAVLRQGGQEMDVPLSFGSRTAGKLTVSDPAARTP